MYIFVISIHFKIATSKNLENGVDDLPYLVSYLYEHASISPYSFCHAALIKDSKNACMLGVYVFSVQSACRKTSKQRKSHMIISQLIMYEMKNRKTCRRKEL